MDVSRAEAMTTLETETRLLAAELYVHFQLTDRARLALNSAAAGVRELSRLYGHRRGEPRKILKLKIHYYEIWQRALVGVLERTNGNSLGAVLLNKALSDAISLVREHQNSSEFQELLRKVKEWQSQ